MGKKDLQDVVRCLDAVDDIGAKVKSAIVDTGRFDVNHQAVHVMGNENRQDEIDRLYFPWSSQVKPIEAGDLAKPQPSADQWNARKWGGGKWMGKLAGKFSRRQVSK